MRGDLLPVRLTDSGTSTLFQCTHLGSEAFTPNWDVCVHSATLGNEVLNVLQAQGVMYDPTLGAPRFLEFVAIRAKAVLEAGMSEGSLELYAVEAAMLSLWANGWIDLGRPIALLDVLSSRWARMSGVSDDTRNRVYCTVCSIPDITADELSKMLELAAATTNWHLRELMAERTIVQTQRKPARYRYNPDRFAVTLFYLEWAQDLLRIPPHGSGGGE